MNQSINIIIWLLYGFNTDGKKAEYCVRKVHQRMLSSIEI